MEFRRKEYNKMLEMIAFIERERCMFSMFEEGSETGVCLFSLHCLAMLKPKYSRGRIGT